MLPTASAKMLMHYYNRTKKHIDRVKKNMIALEGFWGYSKEILSARGEYHDNDKFSEQLMLPYIWITEYYRAKREGELTPELKEIYELCKPYSDTHQTSNSHHPEYYDDVNEMSDLDLIEMVADCTAMSQEFNEPNAKNWFGKNIGNKWKFNAEKIKKIDDLVDETIKRGIVGGDNV